MKKSISVIISVILLITSVILPVSANSDATVVYYVGNNPEASVTGLKAGETFLPDRVANATLDGKYFAGWQDENGNFLLEEGLTLKAGENKLYAFYANYPDKVYANLNPLSKIALPSFDSNGENYLNYTDTDNGYAHRQYINQNGEEYMRLYNSQGWISRIYMQLSDQNGAAYQLKKNTKYFVTVTYKIPQYIAAVDIAVFAGVNIKDRASLPGAYNGVAQTVGYLSETSDPSIVQGGWTYNWVGTGHSQWAATAASSDWQTVKYSFTTGDFNGFLPTACVGINMAQAKDGMPSEFLIKSIEIRDENYTEPATVNYYIGDNLDASVTVQSTGALYTPDRMPSAIPEGKYFAGWAKKDGNIVSEISLESGTVDLYAVFNNYLNSITMDTRDAFNGTKINYPSFVANDTKGEFLGTVDRTGWSYRGVDTDGAYFYSTAPWGMSGAMLISDNDGNAFVAQSNSSYKITVEYKVADIVTAEEVKEYPDGSKYIGGYVSVGVGIGMETTKRRDIEDKNFIIASNVKKYTDVTDWITEEINIETNDISGYLPVVGVFVTSLGVPAKVNADGSISYSDPGDLSYGSNKVIVRKITVEKNPTVTFADKDGNVIAVKSYIVGDKVDFSSVTQGGDIIFSNKTGYTVKDIKWYADKECSIELDVENTFVNSGEYTFYADVTPLTEKKIGQVSFYGFENRVGAPEGFTLVSGFGSNKALKSTSLNKNINIAPNVLLNDGVTYSLTFYYVGSGTISVNGKQVDLPQANEWTKFTTDVCSNERKLTACVVSGSVTVDSFAVNEIISLSGASVLKSDVESQIGKQALRVYASYFVDEEVTERTIILYAGQLSGELNEDTQGAVVTTKSQNLDECWEKTEELLTFSNYIKDLSLKDTRTITVRAYIKTADGNKYYTKQTEYSVENVKVADKLIENKTTYSFADDSVLEKIKVQGAYEKLSGGITLDWTAATVVVTAYNVGETEFKLHIPGNVADQTFTVFVDGQRLPGYYEPQLENAFLQEYSLSVDVGNIPKVHTVEIARRAEAYHGIAEVISVTLNGELVKSEENEMLIEFIGDSITCGMGNLDDSGTALGNDGTQTYAFFAARKAGVDYRMRSRSGSGFQYSSGGESGVKLSWDTTYNIQSPWRNTTNKYLCSREADVVCIYLGTNDVSGWTKATGNSFFSDEEIIVAEMKELVSIVKSYNKNAKIVWISGGITTEYAEFSQRAIAELGGEQAGYYTVTLPKGDSGGGGHPTVAEQKVMGEALYEFLLEKGLI